MSERLWAVRVSVAAMCLAVLSAGCFGTFLAPSPSPPNGVEQLPAPAYMHITGDPAVAAIRLTIAYVLPDGSVPSGRDVVEAGQEIDVSRTSQPGTHELLINGTRCSGAFELQSR